MKRMATFQCRLLVLLVSIALGMLSTAGAAASQAGFIYSVRQEDGTANQIFSRRLRT